MKIGTAQIRPAVSNPFAPKGNGKTLLIVGGLAIGGYLLYKHFKKGSTVELSGTEPVDVDDDEGDD